jgi:hypothetical protein
MDITCWNCKKVTPLDKAAIEKALQAMDASKLGFHDVECASCGKSNRTQREEFEKGLKAASEPKLTQRELTEQTKAENAQRRGDEKPGKPKAQEAIKKAKKKG